MVLLHLILVVKGSCLLPRGKGKRLGLNRGDKSTRRRIANRLLFRGAGSTGCATITGEFVMCCKVLKRVQDPEIGGGEGIE
jgi:hypothetical protein